MLLVNDRLSAEKRRDIAFLLLVAVAAFTVYVNSIGNGLVWDDTIVIIKNSALRGEVLPLFSGIDSGRDVELTPYYRPLTFLTFLIEGQLHGFNPFLMHLINVLLHAVNAFLVYRLARALLNDALAALLAGLLFAVHPVHSEGVDFLSGGRNTMLACFFILMACLAHRRSVIEGSRSCAFAGAAFFLAGLFSKEIAVSLLPFIVAIEITPLRGDPIQRRRAIIRLIPYAACTLFYFTLRSNALSFAGVQVAILPGLGTRLLDNLYIIPRYLLTVIWPLSLGSKYFIPGDLHLLALPLVFGWLCVIVILGWVFMRGRSRATLFGLLWLAAFWLPVSGIIPIPSAPLADRYFYVPAIGLWIVVADQAGRLFPPGVVSRRRAAFVASIILLVLAGLTVRRNLDWKSDITFFSRMVEQYPEKAFGHHNLGCAYLDKMKNLDLAEKEFEKALALDPAFPRLRTQMGYICLLRGDYAGALRHYSEAVKVNPFDAEARLNSGTALERLGRYDEAVAEFRFFLAIPGNELADSRPYAKARVKELSK